MVFILKKFDLSILHIKLHILNSFNGKTCRWNLVQVILLVQMNHIVSYANPLEIHVSVIVVWIQIDTNIKLKSVVTIHKFEFFYSIGWFFSFNWLEWRDSIRKTKISYFQAFYELKCLKRWEQQKSYSQGHQLPSFFSFSVSFTLRLLALMAVV